MFEFGCRTHGPHFHPVPSTPCDLGISWVSYVYCLLAPAQDWRPCEHTEIHRERDRQRGLLIPRPTQDSVSLSTPKPVEEWFRLQRWDLTHLAMSPWEASPVDEDLEWHYPGFWSGGDQRVALIELFTHLYPVLLFKFTAWKFCLEKKKNNPRISLFLWGCFLTHRELIVKFAGILRLLNTIKIRFISF